MRARCDGRGGRASVDADAGGGIGEKASTGLTGGRGGRGSSRRASESSIGGLSLRSCGDGCRGIRGAPSGASGVRTGAVRRRGDVSARGGGGSGCVACMARAARARMSLNAAPRDGAAWPAARALRYRTVRKEGRQGGRFREFKPAPCVRYLTAGLTNSTAPSRARAFGCDDLSEDPASGGCGRA